jgi:hypothetical protein
MLERNDYKLSSGAHEEEEGLGGMCNCKLPAAAAAAAAAGLGWAGRGMCGWFGARRQGKENGKVARWVVSARTVLTYSFTLCF